jgi:hypothetical protein
VTGAFATEHPVVGEQPLHHVSVADFCTLELDSDFIQSKLDTQIGHQRTDDTAFQAILGKALGRDDVEQLIAIHLGSVPIHHQNPIAIPIECDPQISVFFDHCCLERLQMSGANVKVDIEPIGIATDNRNLGPKLPKYLGGHVIGGAMGTVQYDIHAVERKLIGHGALAEFHVPARCVVNAGRLAKLGRAANLNGLVQPALDLGFKSIVQLGAGR